jgi:hypothetical protein
VVNATGNGFTSSFFIHSVQEVHPLLKMAIGGFRSNKAAADNHSLTSDEKTTVPEKSYDAEAGLGGHSAHDDSDESITIGKQIEMEADNAIKYRTCSWPKVCILALC